SPLANSPARRRLARRLAAIARLTDWDPASGFARSRPDEVAPFAPDHPGRSERSHPPGADVGLKTCPASVNSISLYTDSARAGIRAPDTSRGNIHPRVAAVLGRAAR